jgi:hypothetical protein
MSEQLDGLYREAVASSSPGLPSRFGYPGITSENDSFNRNAVASYPIYFKRRNRVAVGSNAFASTRVAEAATLGWRTQPLRG